MYLKKEHQLFRGLKQEARKNLKRHLFLMIFLSLALLLTGSQASFVREMLRQRTAGDNTVLSGANLVGDGSVLDYFRMRGFAVFSGIFDFLSGLFRKMDLLVPVVPAEESLRGLLSALINSLFSGGLFVSLFQTVYSFFAASSLTIRILLPAAFLLYARFSVFVLNLISPAVSRISLQTRVYENVSLNELYFFRRSGRLKNAAKIMLEMKTRQFLWNLTIAGGLVKHYEYLPVPFLLAENPGLTSKEVFTLARDMMRGHKAEAFLLDLSFSGWSLLAVPTFGLSELLWTKPYYRCVLTEYYSGLRSSAVGAGLPYTSELKDRYLFERADSEVLAAAYATNSPAPASTIKLSGWQSFIAGWFGIWTSSQEKKKQYQEEESMRIRYEKAQKEAEGKAYPSRLCPFSDQSRIPEEVRYAWVRCYSPVSIVLMFFMFSFIGYCWEVSLHLIRQHTLTNRGFLHGPWLPIYGIGGVMITILLCRMREKPAREFFSAMATAGVVEYGIARYLELGPYHARYWDYHQMYMNLDGRICAESLLTFGVMGMIVVYLVSPLLDLRLEKHNQKVLRSTAIILLLLFVLDIGRSFASPNTGEGVAVDITEGEWPTTFHHPDHLKINGVEVHTMEEAIQAEQK